MQTRLVLALILLALLTVLVRRPARQHVIATESYEDVYYLPPASWLPFASLGHRDALADLLWIRSLVYLGEEYHQRGALNHIFDYGDAIFVLDPDFEAAYHWMASAGMYQPTAVSRVELLHTIEILTRGVERMPESGQLQWDLGATYAFESSPYAEDDAERDEWQLRGLEHLMAAARLGAAPPWMTLTNATMLTRIGAGERAVEHLEEMYQTVDDPDVRMQIEARIREIRGETHASAFIDESEAEEEGRRRAYPYAHPNLYFLLGPRPPVEVDESLREGFAAHVFDGELDLGGIE